MDTTQSVIPQLMSQTKQLEKTFAYIDGIEVIFIFVSLNLRVCFKF